ncbi:hypothetical protein JZ751_025246 [Albula glossodonta]|uniref:Uncharacterized protein n=1 Tax=Albula glossodonta TaxID=121402 RepID=A0A8T2NEW0_9TELE|nr:hypothetical protein JZ751_025246 [Albula glossodonta]
MSVSVSVSVSVSMSLSVQEKGWTRHRGRAGEGTRSPTWRLEVTSPHHLPLPPSDTYTLTEGEKTVWKTQQSNFTH